MHYGSRVTDATRAPGSDRVLAGLFLLVQAAGAAVCAFLGVMLVFVSDACDSTNCNTGMIVTGMFVTGLGPAGLWLVSLIHTIVRARRGPHVWWVPLVWLLGSAVVAFLGILVAFAGGPNSFS